ncbi:MAG TPA: site-specific integrase [Verrucomicrobiota bacterium]|nr:site-specific integrase [Verrucomicrobiota bacterium]
MQISELDVGAFIPRISDLSSSRYNGIVTMLKATIPTARVLRRRRIQVKERALLSQLEFARLLDALDKRPRSHAGLVIRFLAHTGLRINEARQLKWSDVQADYFLVPASVTKNARVRVIPFVNGIRETLEGLRRVGDGEHILPQSAAKRSLATACKLAGLPRLTHHDFRHLFTTRCIESEVDVGTVARWRGDRDGGAMLLKWYFHLLDPHSRRMAAKVKV